MAGTQRDSAKRDDLSFKGEDKMKGLCDSTFRDVRDISSSQSLLKAESSIDMVTDQSNFYRLQSSLVTWLHKKCLITRVKFHEKNFSSSHED
jgi:hypothetical protein